MGGSISLDPNDIIEMPGQPGKYGRRVLVEALVRAGSPWITSLGRLYAEQKHFYDGWVARLPGFNPADNPDDESQQLAHVRFVAADIDPTPERVRRLTAAGLVRPFDYEPWHWTVPGDARRFAIVTRIPTLAGGNATPIVTPKPLQEDAVILVEDTTGKRGRAMWSGSVWEPLKNAEELNYVNQNKDRKIECGTREFDVLRSIVTRNKAQVTLAQSQVDELVAKIQESLPAGGEVSAEQIADALAGIEFVTTAK